MSDLAGGMDAFIGISDDRLAHMRAVAYRAMELGVEVFHVKQSRARELFAVGFLHDFAYAFSVDQRDHEHLGGEILRGMGLRDWEAIFYHGDPDVEDMSDELLILNIADMQTNGRGERVSFSERLADIARRYGTDSEQYIRAAQLVTRIHAELSARNIHPAEVGEDSDPYFKTRDTTSST